MTNRTPTRRAAGVALAIVAFAAGFGAATSVQAGPVVDKIKERGVIRVGVGSEPGFFTPTPTASGRASSSTSAARSR